MVSSLSLLKFGHPFACAREPPSCGRPPDARESWRLVRAKGLEPPHLSILEPKSSASTSSATPAWDSEVGGVYSSAGAGGKTARTRAQFARPAGNPGPAASLAEVRRSPMATPLPTPAPAPPPVSPPAPPPEIIPPAPDIDVPDPGAPPAP